VSGILVDGDMRVLLGLRNKEDAAFPGMWCTPGGTVEWGEPLDVALAREFVEETGLIVKPTPNFISIQERVLPDRHTVLVFKTVELVNGLLIAGDGFEKVDWFTQLAVSNLSIDKLLTPLTDAALKEFWGFA
jgi:8-oxo-dGTP diphosphatase